MKRLDEFTYSRSKRITALLGLNALPQAHHTFLHTSVLTLPPQYVLGTMVDAYHKGYDVTHTHTAATISPAGRLVNVICSVSELAFGGTLR